MCLFSVYVYTKEHFVVVFYLQVNRQATVIATLARLINDYFGNNYTSVLGLCVCKLIRICIERS